jgi:hypothetical protein
VKVSTSAAWLLSYVFHPVLLLAVSACLGARTDAAGQIWLIFLLMLLAPLLLLMALRLAGHVSSYHLPLRSERDLLYSLQLLWFGLLLAGSSQWTWLVPGVLNRVVLAVIGIGLLSIANRYLNKASAHMAVVTALAAVYAQEAGIRWLPAGLAAMGLVWFARSSVKAHTGPQLLTGLVVGLLSWLCWSWLV